MAFFLGSGPRTVPRPMGITRGWNESDLGEVVLLGWNNCRLGLHIIPLHLPEIGLPTYLSTALADRVLDIKKPSARFSLSHHIFLSLYPLHPLS